jgi:pimeloyl-ACP methyl ester carboxylesterase
MHLYPSVVHAAVLDSVYPTNHNRNELPSDAQRAFNVLFQGCAKDSKCNAKYPNLQSVFYSLVDQLNANPITLNTTDATTGQQYTLHFAGDDLVGWLFSTLYATPFIPELPQTIYQVKEGNYTQLSTLEGEVGFDSTFSDGMFFSAECSEDWPFLTPQDITTSEQGITPQIAKVFGQEDEQQEYAVCQFWKVNRVPAAQKQPVVSNAPTLIVTGEYDPITPPALGQEVGKSLSHSYFFTFPGQGHGQQYSSACSDHIISTFEDNPNQQPDGSCISQMTEPAFV